MLSCAFNISSIDCLKSAYGSGEWVNTATEFFITEVVSDTRDDDDDDEPNESIMEFDWPGDEMKKRWEAYTADKSGVDAA